jgi:hypothetical protein
MPSNLRHTDARGSATLVSKATVGRVSTRTTDERAAHRVRWMLKNVEDALLRLLAWERNLRKRHQQQ